MTGRLIDADRLLEDLKEDEEASKMPLMWHNGIMYAEEHINLAPTVDAVPVEWIKKYMSRCLAIEQDAIGEMVKEWAEREEE